jgi:hypothetical protein
MIFIVMRSTTKILELDQTSIEHPTDSSDHYEDSRAKRRMPGLLQTRAQTDHNSARRNSEFGGRVVAARRIDAMAKCTGR